MQCHAMGSAPPQNRTSSSPSMVPAQTEYLKLIPDGLASRQQIKPDGAKGDAHDYDLAATLRGWHCCFAAAVPWTVAASTKY